MVLGHQKGRDTKERGLRNFGMSRPEGYRKALRLMKLAEKFGLPVFTFVDTPGAYPGIGAEERGQSEAIGRNIFEMAQLEVPIITTIIGEGGSGGALAISVADQVLMLQYSVYSVISPEGCASILWKTAERASDAAEALGITAHRLKALGLIDKIVSEPVGGAHRDTKQMAAYLKRALNDALRQVRRPEAQGTAAAPLRAAAVLRPLQRHQGALSRGRGGRARSRWPSAAAAIRRRCCMPRSRGARPLGVQVVALHVHHGLQPEADAWVAHCSASAGAGQRAACRSACSGSGCRARRPPATASRPGRAASAMRALAAMARARGAGIVLLAHHRRDQAETFAAAGTARRRAGRPGGHAARGAARRHHLGAALAGAAARGHRRLSCGATA